MVERIVHYATKTEGRSHQILHALLKKIEQEEVRGKNGRHGHLCSQKILQSCLFGIEKRTTDETWLQLESKKKSENVLRSLRDNQITYRSKNKKQFKGKHTDSLQELSQLLALDAEEAWSKYRWENASALLSSWKDGWEDGFSRTVFGSSFRMDRIKCLGNSVVPIQVETAFKKLIGIV